MSNNYNSALTHKLASMKFKLRIADAAFEGKHPRDGGKFTSNGGSGDSEKKDKKPNPKMSNLVKIDKIFTYMERKADPDQQGTSLNFSSSMINETAKKFNITPKQAETIWDSAGGTDIDVS